MGKVGNLKCIICCTSHQGNFDRSLKKSGSDANEKNDVFQKFCEKVLSMGVLGKGGPSIDGLEEDGFGACLKCKNFMSSIMASMTRMDGVEGRVRELQMSILEEMKELSIYSDLVVLQLKRMEQFVQKTSEDEDFSKNSEDSDEEKDSDVEGQGDEDQGQNDKAVLIRDSVLKVTKEMTLFRDGLLKKFFFQPVQFRHRYGAPTVAKLEEMSQAASKKTRKSNERAPSQSLVGPTSTAKRNENVSEAQDVDVDLGRSDGEASIQFMDVDEENDTNVTLHSGDAKSEGNKTKMAVVKQKTTKAVQSALASHSLSPPQVLKRRGPKSKTTVDIVLEKSVDEPEPAPAKKRKAVAGPKSKTRTETLSSSNEVLRDQEHNSTDDDEGIELMKTKAIEDFSKAKIVLQKNKRTSGNRAQTSSSAMSTVDQTEFQQPGKSLKKSRTRSSSKSMDYGKYYCSLTPFEQFAVNVLLSEENPVVISDEEDDTAPSTSDSFHSARLYLKSFDREKNALFIQYHPETRSFRLKQIEVVIDEEDKSVKCSQCDFIIPLNWPPKQSSDHDHDVLSTTMKMHIFGHHLGGFQCKMCGVLSSDEEKFKEHITTEHDDSDDGADGNHSQREESVVRVSGRRSKGRSRPIESDDESLFSLSTSPRSRRPSRKSKVFDDDIWEEPETKKRNSGGSGKRKGKWLRVK